MKSTLEFNAADIKNVNATLSITMKVEEWRYVARALESSSATTTYSDGVLRAIRQLIDKVSQTFELGAYDSLTEPHR